MDEFLVDVAKAEKYLAENPNAYQITVNRVTLTGKIVNSVILISPYIPVSAPIPITIQTPSVWKRITNFLKKPRVERV